MRNGKPRTTSRIWGACRMSSMGAPLIEIRGFDWLDLGLGGWLCGVNEGVVEELDGSVLKGPMLLPAGQLKRA